MIKHKLIGTAVGFTFLLLGITISDTAVARGGGGHGGGGGGGFRGGGGFGGFRGGYGGGGFRDGGSRDGMGRGWGNGGFGAEGARSERPAEAARPRVSDDQLRAGANQNYNWGSGRSLATDGVGRLASAGVRSSATRHVSPYDMATRGNTVRRDYAYGRAFDHDWWGRHRDAWPYSDWWGYGWWGGSGWGDLAYFWGIPEDDEPTEYDYGDNITYQDDNVYYGSNPVESTQTYYTQAQNLATSAPANPPANAAPAVLTKSIGSKNDWKPLGVYSLVQGDQSNTTMMFQIAVNKKGIVKGNYYNPLTEDLKPISGAVDKKNMRVAWIVSNNKSVVYDTGLANLLKSQGVVLVHYGKDKTQQWTLVKLDKPSAPAPDKPKV